MALLVPAAMNACKPRSSFGELHPVISVRVIAHIRYSLMCYPLLRPLQPTSDGIAHQPITCLIIKLLSPPMDTERTVSDHPLPASGKRQALCGKSSNISQLESESALAITTVPELAGNVEAVLKDYAPYRLGVYEASNGVVFSEAFKVICHINDLPLNTMIRRSAHPTLQTEWFTYDADNRVVVNNGQYSCYQPTPARARQRL